MRWEESSTTKKIGVIVESGFSFLVGTCECF
jgi:hypothetical protein